MPPKKIKIEETKIEYMNVPLKSGYRYATEDEAIKDSKVLLWGKHAIPENKLTEVAKYFKPPKPIKRAKEFKRDFLLSGIDVKVRGKREKNESESDEEDENPSGVSAQPKGAVPPKTKTKAKDKDKKYEKEYVKSHKYTVSDLKLLNKFYDELSKQMDDEPDNDDLADLQGELYDLIEKLEKGDDEEEEREPEYEENPNKARIRSLQDDIAQLHADIRNHKQSPEKRNFVIQTTEKINSLFDEIQKLENVKLKIKKGKGIKKNNIQMNLNRKMVGGHFEKEHGKSNPVQPYFYFGKMPTHITRTKWRPATAEEAVNNGMIALYGVHKVPDKLEKLAKTVGHAGNLEGLNKSQLTLMLTSARAKYKKANKDFDSAVFARNSTQDEEMKKEYQQKMDDINERASDIYDQILAIIEKYTGEKTNKKFKPFSEKLDNIETQRDVAYIEPVIEHTFKPEPQYKPREPKLTGDYTPRQPKETPKHDLNIDIAPTNFKPSKISHVFINDDNEIHLNSKYFKDNIIMDKYAKKLSEKNIYLQPKFYTEKMTNKIFYHDSGTVVGTGINGGKIHPSKFFNKIGSVLTDTGNKIQSGLTSAVNTVQTGLESGLNYASKVIHGVDDYLPPVREIINKYGNNTITGVTVGRAPVPTAITMALNGVSGGTFKEGMNSQPYDKLFHLFLYLTMNDGNKILFEKNATINSAVNSALPADTETLLITPPNNTTTLKTFLQNGQTKMGNSYFVYDPHYNNCQDYIIGLLTGNGWGTQQDYKWIKQDTGQLFANNKYLGTVAKGVTNFGGVVDRMIKGVGFKKKNHIQSILFKRPEYTGTKAKKWLLAHHFKTDVDVKPNHLRYRQCEPNENKYDYKTQKINNDIEFIIGYEKK